MRYQDPLAPTDSTQFPTQTAQFTTVSGLQQIEKDQQAMQHTNELLAASGMVGRRVTYATTDASGERTMATSPSAAPHLESAANTNGTSLASGITIKLGAGGNSSRVETGAGTSNGPQLQIEAFRAPRIGDGGAGTGLLTRERATTNTRHARSVHQL